MAYTRDDRRNEDDVPGGPGAAAAQEGAERDEPDAPDAPGATGGAAPGEGAEREGGRPSRRERTLAKRARRREGRLAYLAYMLNKMDTKPVAFALFVILRLLVLAEAIRSLVVGHYYSVFMCVVVLALLMVPSMLERSLRIELPSTLEVIVLLFVFAAEFLGEVDQLYVKLPFWDTMLHTMWGFLCAGVGFALVDFLNRSQATRIQLTPLYMAVTAVTFSMAVSVCWEMFEFTMDSVLGVDMQKDEIVTSFGSVLLDPNNSNEVISVDDIVSTTITLASGETIVVEGGYLDIGINDTMWDIIVNFIGAVVFSLFGYAYVKTRGANAFAAGFIPRVLPKDWKPPVDELLARHFPKQAAAARAAADADGARGVGAQADAGDAGGAGAEGGAVDTPEDAPADPEGARACAAHAAGDAHAADGGRTC